ncbi:MAG TPA: hypothetical protein VFJ53_03670 [Solirubrobacterales bacterium]|nr:hypothetical protein [Solirubrobacterales bacterium]
MRRTVAVALLAVLVLAGVAQGERAQHGNLIVQLDGSFAPLTLPRDRKAPVSIHLEAGLTTADHTVLPRVRGFELGIPGQGLITTRGLPVCTPQRLRNTTTEKALALCRPALVGRGRMVAQVKVPNQAAFMVHARLLAFNGRVHGRRAVIVHGISGSPPTVVALPFLIEHRAGKFGTALVAHLPRDLGPWPRFARFEINLSRRYSYQGRQLSYISASCPIPAQNTAGFFSFAKATFTLAHGRRVGIAIPRSCRAA